MDESGWLLFHLNIAWCIFNKKILNKSLPDIVLHLFVFSFEILLLHVVTVYMDHHPCLGIQIIDEDKILMASAKVVFPYR